MSPEPADDELTRSPLDARHRALHATLVAFAGWAMPLRYGSELAEHHAVRNAAGVFDLSHMGEIAVRGPQAGALLDAALVGWLSALEVGQARYTMACAASGGVLDDLVVYRRGQDDFLVVANAANTATIHSLLAGHSGPGAAVEDETAATALVALQGPHAPALFAAVTGVDLAGLRNYRATARYIAGAPALVARTGYTGEDGVEVFLPPDAAGALFDALLEAGAPDGVLACGLAARDSLRLEAGMPLYGNELTLETNPYEAGLGRVVRLDKPGDFSGRSALEHIAATGVTRRLAGLESPGPRSPRHGQRVLAAVGDEAIGVVTSGAPSPSLGHPVAMAYLPVGVAVAGTALRVDVRGRLEPAVVVDLPFYRRGATHPAPSHEGDA